LEKYKIIYADPPWRYTNHRNGKKTAAYHYPIMPFDEVKALPVREIADKNSILFMWATPPCLPQAFELMKAWGFVYKTVAFTWIKFNKNGTPFWGLGHYTRANPEYCLLGTRGRVKRVSASVHSVIMTQIREHSRKPDEARDKIIELMGELTRIELFARQQVPGWTVWGNEVENSIDLAYKPN